MKLGLLTVPRLGARALDNAREGTLQVVRQLLERSALTDAVQTTAEESPGLSHLTDEQAWALLGRHQVGRLAYVAREGHPDVVPVTYVLDGREVLFASGRGPKLQAVERRERLALEVDEVDEPGRSGVSVVVSGRAVLLHESDVAARRQAGRPLPAPWAPGSRPHVVLLRAPRVTGRRLVQEHPR